MKKIYLILVSLLVITSCKHQNEIPSLRYAVDPKTYYPGEIVNSGNTKIYGQWQFLYKQGGFGGWIIDPTYDYLEIIPFGIYGIIDNDAIQVIGKIQIDQQDEYATLVDFLPDQITAPDYQIGPKSVWLQSPDTLILFDLCADCYADVFKRIK